MSHIHADPGQHDFTVSAFIIRTDFAQPKLMLHRHKKLNFVMQFGGHVELDENPWVALVREIKEESGYDIKQLKILQPRDRLKKLRGSINHPNPVYINTHPIDTGDLKGNHFHTDIGYAFVANKEPVSPPSEDESEDILLFTREEITESDILPSVTDICLHIFDVCLAEYEQIPAKLNI